MRVCLFVIVCLFTKGLFSETQGTIYYLDSSLTVISSQLLNVNEFKSCSGEKPNPVFELFRKKQRLNKRITAAVLAFPFPFGIVGLHRIYLGTKPYVPVAYIASLGGVFGILPFIDFCVITFDKKNFENYQDNGHVFMWFNK